MGTKFRRMIVVLFCLSGLVGVGCSSHDDDRHDRHRRDRWDDRRDHDHDDYRPGPRGNRTED